MATGTSSCRGALGTDEDEFPAESDHHQQEDVSRQGAREPSSKVGMADTSTARVSALSGGSVRHPATHEVIREQSAGEHRAQQHSQQHGTFTVGPRSWASTAESAR